VPVIPALGMLKQEDGVFEVSLDYIARPCLKNKKEQSKVKKTKAYKFCSGGGTQTGHNTVFVCYRKVLLFFLQYQGLNSGPIP
jgi:hypothetical protein